MHVSLSKSLLMLTLTIILVSPSHGAVPETMHVQGRLVDSTGMPLPAGPKTFTFKIYDAEAGGTELWPASPGEAQAIETDARGLWNAHVGAVLPLLPEVFDEPMRWLQVIVDDGVSPPDTMPRIQLTTTPYTYRSASSMVAENAAHADVADLALDAGNSDMLDSAHLGDIQVEIDANVAAHAASDDHAGWYVNAAGDTMTSNLDFDHFADGTLDARIDVGNAAFKSFNGSGDVVAEIGRNPVTPFGQLRLFERAGPYELRVDLSAENYGLLELLDADENVSVGLSAALGNAGGGLLELNKPNLFAGVSLWAGNDTTGASLDLADRNGVTRIRLDGDGSRDSAVVLPDSSVSAQEILDEPGIARATAYFGNIPVSNSGVTNIMSGSITVPGPGWVTVNAQLNAQIQGTTIGNIIIDVAATSAVSTANGAVFGASDEPLAANIFRWGSLAIEETFQVFSAGTYTYYLNAERGWTGGNAAVTDPRMHLAYYPTSYGTVSTLVSSPENQVYRGVESD